MWLAAVNLRVPICIGWMLSEIVCNSSGLGFNGYDENGKAKWDLQTNVHILNVEVSFA